MSDFDDEILRAVGETFRVESEERIATINRRLVALESSAEDAPALLDEIAREAHTLKGGASILGLDEIATAAHALESGFAALRDRGATAPVELFDALYAGLDALGEACRELRPPEGAAAGAIARMLDVCRRFASGADDAPPPTADRPPVASALPRAEPVAAEVVRVPVRKLDSLMSNIGELLVSRHDDDARLASVRGLERDLEDALRTWASLKEIRRDAIGADARRRRLLAKRREGLLDRLESRLTEAASCARSLRTGLARDANRLTVLSKLLEFDIRSARMLPLATILEGLDRHVRDVARREEKRARLEVAGGALEVDKLLLETIKDPLMHLVRNAVSHGIEGPEAREAAGKPPVGTVSIDAHRAGSSLVVEVADDGRGFDVARLRDRAAALGLSDGLDAKSDDGALRLAFAPGLSTSERVSSVSGRGVGMDVVRSAIERIQGDVSVASELGAGARVTLRLPLTLSTTNCLVVDAASQRLALPIAVVDRLLRVERRLLSLERDAPVLEIDGGMVAAFSLGEALGFGRLSLSAPRERLWAAILDVAGARVACLVDGVIEEKELLVKPLGPLLPRVRFVSGATVVGSGEVLLVLNAVELARDVDPPSLPLAASLARQSGATGHLAPPRRIVVAEDSPTTRTLLASVLEAAGYRVDACADGLEAIEAIGASHCDLLLADVEMPRMGGIALVERLRDAPEHRDLPILLLSSAGTELDRRNATIAGADGYIVKTSFDQNRLLETIATLIARRDTPASVER